MSSIRMRLPAGPWSIWSPAAAAGLVGKETVFEIDSVRAPVTITAAALDDDPSYIHLTLEVADCGQIDSLPSISPADFSIGDRVTR